MSRYISIVAAQRPITSDLSIDSNERVLFSLNIDARAAAPVEQWEREIVKILSDASLATLGVDTFVGPKAVIPDGDGPFINILTTGGFPAEETHDGQRYERPAAQLIIRGANYETTLVRALAVWRALDGVTNQTVTL